MSGTDSIRVPARGVGRDRHHGITCPAPMIAGGEARSKPPDVSERVAPVASGRDPPACKHVSEDRWVQDGSKVGENRGPREFSRVTIRPATPVCQNRLILIILCTPPSRLQTEPNPLHFGPHPRRKPPGLSTPPHWDLRDMKTWGEYASSGVLTIPGSTIGAFSTDAECASHQAGTPGGAHFTRGGGD